MVSAKLFADVIQGKIGQLTQQIHGNLPWNGNFSGSVISLQIFRLQGKILCRFSDNIIRVWNIRPVSSYIFNCAVNRFFGDVVI